eukprot:gene16294-19335_t
MTHFGVRAPKDPDGNELKFKECSDDSDHRCATSSQCQQFMRECVIGCMLSRTRFSIKVQNEAVIEGQGSTIDRHADKTRGLTQEKYVMGSFVDYNGPVSHEAEEFIIKALDKRFEKSRD